MSKQIKRWKITSSKLMTDITYCPISCNLIRIENSVIKSFRWNYDIIASRILLLSNLLNKVSPNRRVPPILKSVLVKMSLLINFRNFAQEGSSFIQKIWPVLLCALFHQVFTDWNFNMVLSVRVTSRQFR